MALYHRATPYLYLAAPLALLGVFFVWPFLQTLHVSLLDYGQNLYAPRFAGLGNYRLLLAAPDFWRALMNTFIFVVCVVPAMVALPLLVAILVNVPLKGMQLIRTLLYIPVVLSMVVVGITWKWLYAGDGLLNYLLGLIGLPRVGWLTNPDVALYAVALVVVWKGLAYYMMMYLAHLQSMQAELYDAAAIDGAGALQRHWHLTLPHLKPTVFMVVLISTIGGLKTFTEIYVLTRGGPMGSTQTLLYYIYQKAFENLDLGLASAAGLTLMAILLAISLLQVRLMRAQHEDDATTAPTKATAKTSVGVAG